MELKEAWKLVLSGLDDAILDHQLKLDNSDMTDNCRKQFEDSLVEYKQAVEMLEEVYQADM
jgi:hypothetical protein